MLLQLRTTGRTSESLLTSRNWSLILLMMPAAKLL